MRNEAEGTCMEDVMIDHRKKDIIAAMEEHFPNGGRDHDLIVELVEALIAGKIPLLGLNY